VTVLVVDDERDVAELYATWLSMEHDVRRAHDGEKALEKVDQSVDVVFLDRQMPGMSGDEVLDAIDDRGIDCRVVMVTAVDPGFDIVEMPFDDYLNKPVEKRDLVNAIEQQLTAERYDERLTEYLEVTSKLALLESEKPEPELEGSEEITRLRERADRLRDELDETLAEFDDARTAFKEIERD